MAEWCIPLLSATFRLSKDPNTMYVVTNLQVVVSIVTTLLELATEVIRGQKLTYVISEL